MEQIARTTQQVGAVLRRHRRKVGLTQSALGARSGLRQATISALERGEPGTQLRTLVDVLAALGLEVAIRERSKASETIEDVF